MAAIMKPMTCMFLIAAVAPLAKAAVGCGTVVSYMNPCIPYVTNKGLLGGCCNGVKGLYNAAKITPDKQSVCNCLKPLAGSCAGLDYSKAAGLLGQCGVSIPYKISLLTDCSKYVCQ